MKTKHIVILIIISALFLKFFYFNEPNYLGKWENIADKKQLQILKNNLVIYQIEGFGEFYGDWSEIKKNEILIRYKVLGIDQSATFKSNSGEVGYFDDHGYALIFTRIEN